MPVNSPYFSMGPGLGLRLGNTMPIYGLYSCFTSRNYPITSLTEKQRACGDGKGSSPHASGCSAQQQANEPCSGVHEETQGGLRYVHV